MWVEFAYYRDVFKGTLITDESIFPKYSQVAQDYVDYITLGKAGVTIENGLDTDKIKRSVCVACELYLEKENKLNAIKTSDNEIVARGLKSETVKSHSVTYASTSDLDTLSKIETEYDKLIRTKVNKLLMFTGLLNRGIG